MKLYTTYDIHVNVALLAIKPYFQEMWSFIRRNRNFYGGISAYLHC